MLLIKPKNPCISPTASNLAILVTFGGLKYSSSEKAIFSVLLKRAPSLLYLPSPALYLSYPDTE